jgi:hypothetical protein
MMVLERPGNGADPWCAVAPHPSGWAFVWNEPGKVWFELPSGAKTAHGVPGDFLRYLDAAGAPNGDVAAIGVGSDDRAYLVGSWTPTAMPLDIVVGNFAVGIYWDGQRFIPLQVVSSTHYTRNRGTPQVIPIGATSQGIRQTFSDGSIVWGDQAHVVTVAGRTIHKYQHVDFVCAGQRNGPDHIDLYDGAKWWTPIKGSAQPPRLCAVADGYAVCAGTSHGAVLAVGPPWPALIPDTPIPPIPPEDTMFPEKLKDGQNVHVFVARELKATKLLGKGSTPQERRDHAALAILQVAAKANVIEGREAYGLRSKHREAWTLLPLKAAGTIGVYSDLLAYCDTNAASSPFYSADVVTSAELPSAGTGWSNEARVTDTRHRFVKPSEIKTDTTPEPPDPPPTGTHLYIGGGNDTGICDECGLSRFDDIHKIPESQRPHGYDGGEQDTGLCDICQLAEPDPIHHGGDPPPGDCSQWIAQVEALQAENARLTAENEQLRAEVDRLLAEVQRLLDLLEQQPPGTPCECVLSGPAWAIRLFGISCAPKVR